MLPESDIRHTERMIRFFGQIPGPVKAVMVGTEYVGGVSIFLACGVPVFISASVITLFNGTVLLGYAVIISKRP